MPSLGGMPIISVIAQFSVSYCICFAQEMCVRVLKGMEHGFLVLVMAMIPLTRALNGMGQDFSIQYCNLKFNVFIISTIKKSHI